MTTRPAEPEITWTLPLPQANVVLNILGEQKFNQIADLITELRNQAQAQMQLYQQQMQQSMLAAASQQKPVPAAE